MDLYIHSSIRLHGVMLNLLRTGTTLFLQAILPEVYVFFLSHFKHLPGQYHGSFSSYCFSYSTVYSLYTDRAVE
jgi:hypothetical protein